MYTHAYTHTHTHIYISMTNKTEILLPYTLTLSLVDILPCCTMMTKVGFLPREQSGGLTHNMSRIPSLTHMVFFPLDQSMKATPEFPSKGYERYLPTYLPQECNNYKKDQAQEPNPKNTSHKNQSYVMQ